MKIRNGILANTPPEDRASCGWPHCHKTPQHTAEFQIKTARRGWIDRRMGLCDKHRGALRRKYPHDFKKGRV